MSIPNFQTKTGWVMVNKKTGEIWLDTFATSKQMARAIAIEHFAIVGDLIQDHPEWVPLKGIMTVVLLKN